MANQVLPQCCHVIPYPSSICRNNNRKKLKPSVPHTQPELYTFPAEFTRVVGAYAVFEIDSYNTYVTRTAYYKVDRP